MRPLSTVPCGRVHGIRGRPQDHGYLTRNEGVENVEGGSGALSILELIAQA